MADSDFLLNHLIESVKTLLVRYKIDLITTELTDNFGNVRGVVVSFQRDGEVSEELEFATDIPAEAIGCVFFVACIQEAFDCETDDGALYITVPPVAVIRFAPNYVEKFKKFRASVRRLLAPSELITISVGLLFLEGCLVHTTATSEGDRDTLSPDHPVKPYLLN